MLLKKTEIFIKTLKEEKTAGDKEVEDISKEKASQPRVSNKMAERVDLSLWHREAWAHRDVVIRGKRDGALSLLPSQPQGTYPSTCCLLCLGAGRVVLTT